MSEYLFIPDVDDTSIGFVNTERSIELPEARARFGRTAGLDRKFWTWTAGDVRWLVGHWFLFRRDLERLDRLGDELTDLARAEWPTWYRLARAQHEAVTTLFRSLVDGVRWHLDDAPLALRAFTAVCMLFAYAFALGRF